MSKDEEYARKERVVSLWNSVEQDFDTTRLLIHLTTDPGLERYKMLKVLDFLKSLYEKKS